MSVQGPILAVPDMLSEAHRHYRTGGLTEAECICCEILSIDDCHADALHLLGVIAFQRGSYETAAQRMRKSIAINDKKAQYHSNLGNVFQAQGKLIEAGLCYRRALTLKPDLAEGHINLGNILQAQGLLEDAVAKFKQALALKPELAEAYYNLGNAFRAQGKLDEAAAQYEQALVIQPDYAHAYHNLGSVRMALGKPVEALVAYRHALDLQPNYAQARFSESLAQIYMGNFCDGWRNYASRWRSPDHKTPMRDYSQPLWTGERLSSGSVLIWGEQGIGDEIMFAGLIPDVIRTGNRCILDCDTRLNRLFTRSFPEVHVISGHDPSRSQEFGIAAHLPAGSLPALFRTNNASFSAAKSPYLIADPLQQQRFRNRYDDGRRLVGLAWYTKNQETGRCRSIDLSLLTPLFHRSDIQWISLQYGDHDGLQAQVAAAGEPIVIDRSVDQFMDIDIFAAQIAALDLVVTIDNSTAHLAGALGVPVLLLLPFAPDWRWMHRRKDSPWYPTMQLFRQPKLDDWQSVVQEVRQVL